MKIKQLIKKLVDFDPELEVIIATDQEGNGYNILTEVVGGSELKFWKEDREICLATSKDIPDDEPEEKEKFNKAKSCIVLYP